MLNIIKTLLLDFLEVPLETGVSRELGIEILQGKATVCMGVRRCGKSTYLFQTMQKLIDNGISRENILYLNFFDDRLHGLEQAGLELVHEAYYSLYPEKKNSEKVYCFFDEIQMIFGWETFVDRLLRTEKCEIYITGSSARMLSKEIATQMRGRALSWELFPFSFREFLKAKDINVMLPASTKRRLLLQKGFEDFWKSGGFPEVIDLEQQLRIKIHQEYLHAILFRDLIERHNISHPTALTSLAYKLIDSVGSMYSLNSLTGYLKSLGHKAPKDAIGSYIEWFEDAYFLFTVRLFDSSISRSNANPKKIYCIDHSFVNSISSGILVNSGHLLENIVFIALRRMYSQIFYYKTRNNKEVDFIFQLQDRTKKLIQVCESIANEQTRKREIAALYEAMVELDLSSGMIVTRQEEEQIEVDGRKIRVLPVWRFLLEQNNL